MVTGVFGADQSRTIIVISQRSASNTRPAKHGSEAARKLVSRADSSVGCKACEPIRGPRSGELARKRQPSLRPSLTVDHPKPSSIGVVDHGSLTR